MNADMPVHRKAPLVLLTACLVLTACVSRTVEVPATVLVRETVVVEATAPPEATSVAPQPATDTAGATATLTDTFKEEILFSAMDYALEGNYDSRGVLPKYREHITVRVTNGIATFMMDAPVDSIQDFNQLAAEVILIGAVFSELGNPKDMGLERIEFVQTGGPTQVKYYASRDDLLRLLSTPGLPMRDILKVEFIDLTGCPGGCTVPPPGCSIKGNVSFDTSERIFHVPGGEFYDATVIDPAYGERWFCTEQEAVDAGWRRSER